MRLPQNRSKRTEWNFFLPHRYDYRKSGNAHFSKFTVTSLLRYKHKALPKKDVGDIFEMNTIWTSGKLVLKHNNFRLINR